MPSPVNLFREAERSQQMADLLMQRAQAPRGPVQTGRQAPNYNVGTGLGQIGEALLARRAGKRAKSSFETAEQARQEMLAQALSGTTMEPAQAQAAIESGLDPQVAQQMMSPELVSVMGEQGPEYVRAPEAVGRQPYWMARGQGSALMQAYRQHVMEAQAAGQQPQSFDDFVPWFAQNQVGVLFGSPADVPGVGVVQPSRIDPSRTQVISPESSVASSQAQRQAQQTAATEQAEQDIATVNDLPMTVQRAQDALSTVDQLINHPGRAAGTGTSRNLGGGLQRFAPWASAVKDFETLRSQAQGQVFLEAYQLLKGGGQITEVEGLKAEQAKARMDAAQTDDAFVSALIEYREAISRGLNKLISKAEQAGVRLDFSQPQAVGGTIQRQTPSTPSEVNWGDLPQ